MGVFEDYASKFFQGGIGFWIQAQGQEQKITGINYKLFKLFFLSVFWRASVSDLDFFDKVKMQKINEIIIRDMLKKNDPGKAESFPFIMITSFLRRQALLDLIVKPDKIYVEGHRCFRFVLNGIFWIFFESKISDKFPKKEIFLSEKGEIVNRLEKAENMDYFKDIAGDLLDSEIIDL
jgi:hypothetical protein